MVKFDGRSYGGTRLFIVERRRMSDCDERKHRLRWLWLWLVPVYRPKKIVRYKKGFGMACGHDQGALHFLFASHRWNIKCVYKKNIVQVYIKRKTIFFVMVIGDASSIYLYLWYLR